MPSETIVENFVINKVESQSVFDQMVEQGLVDDGQLYLIPGQGASIDDTTPSTGTTYSSKKIEDVAKSVLPSVTASDAGKFLRVSIDGAWTAEALPVAEEASF